MVRLIQVNERSQVGGPKDPVAEKAIRETRPVIGDRTTIISFGPPERRLVCAALYSDETRSSTSAGARTSNPAVKGIAPPQSRFSVRSRIMTCIW